jgi:hypothetical protein
VLRPVVPLSTIMVEIHECRGDCGSSGLGRAILRIGSLSMSTMTEIDSCAYRKSNPAILMMQSAQDRAAENAPGGLDGT